MADTLIRLTQTDLDADTNKLLNLADGTVATDAVNKGQLDAAVAGVVTVTRFVYSEILAGTINGSNTVFTTAFSPVAGTLQVHKNGQRLTPTADYSVTGSTVTFVKAPKGMDVLLVDYIK